MWKRWTAWTLLLLMLACAFPAGAGGEADGPVLESMEEVLQYICYDCAYMLHDDITFYYTEELDEEFSTPDALHVLLKNCGMYDWTQYRDTDRRRVRIRDIQYWTGYRIAQAWEIEMLGILTEEEMEVYRIAQQMVAEAQRYAPSPYDVLVKLHDALCARTVYELNENEGMNIQDSAVGALKYGRAECDGYADAFYLLASLAGFPAGYQEGGTDGDLTGHIWNVVFWDGEWYHMDVTWNDLDCEGYPEMVTYAYFMVGGEMNTDHRWIEEYSPYRLAAYNNWDCFYYTADRTGQTYGAYYGTLGHAADYVADHIRRGYRRVHVMVDGYYENGKELNELIHENVQWMTYTHHKDGYTLFDVVIK